ncbi:MAG TPA: hypothetical protein VL652_34875 [Kutzneria sp.]|jgi:hypothetical protein|nr:hypothetical protein [Kutzneria sp.]
MTTDIAIPQSGADLVAFGAPSDALARLGEWVEAAGHAHRLVAPLVGTAFIPDAYKPKVDPRATPEEKAEARATAIANATAAVLQGITLGLDPMTALQQIYVVHGRPGMYAKIKVALLQSKGHEVWTEDLTDTRAVVAGRRRGSQQIERITVTMDQARKAGWTRNDNYAKTPQDMLWARAAGRVCDRVAPDALMGIASVEEIQDTIAAPESGARTVKPPRRAAAAIPAAPEEPPLDDEPVAAEPQPQAPEPAEPITTAQQRKLHALLRERDLTDREAGLAQISLILGRDVESTKDLSKADAMSVIDTLMAAPETAEPELDGEQ